jgi:hypothetical protein
MLVCALALKPLGKILFKAATIFDAHWEWNESKSAISRMSGLKWSNIGINSPPFGKLKSKDIYR